MIKEYEFIVNVIAGMFLAVAQFIYIYKIAKKQITPSLFTWLGWSILVGVSLFSQIYEYGWNWALMGHLFSAFGCFIIFISTLITKNFIVVKKDWTYLYIGSVCIIIYTLFKDPWSTTIFAILADGILGIPTILKAIKNPNTERSLGWNIALGCWSLTIITCIDEDFIYVLFPAYCLAFNLTMSYLTTKKRILFFNQQQLNIDFPSQESNHLL